MQSFLPRAMQAPDGKRLSADQRGEETTGMEDT